MYLHPRSIDLERLIGVIKDGKIIPYLDIPIQHASDRILSSMGRGYGRVYLEELFGVIKTELPDIVLRTTVMVGFPGETEEEFYELLDFLERYEIDHVGVFGYSPESGTRAFSYPGRVEYDIIEATIPALVRLLSEKDHLERVWLSDENTTRTYTLSSAQKEIEVTLSFPVLD